MQLGENISPGLFNIIKHLPVHLPYEVLLGGTVQLGRCTHLSALHETFERKHLKCRSILSPRFHELVQCSIEKIRTSPMYFTCVFMFQAYEYGRGGTTINYGICLKGETEIYETL